MSDKKKYDLAIMNPPYDRNLHLKILEKVIPVAEETINISPIRWLQDPLAKYKKNSDYNKFKESVAEHITNVKEVSANDLFGTQMIQDCGIYKIKSSHKRTNFDFGLYNINADKFIDAKLKYPKLEIYNEQIAGKRTFVPIKLIVNNARNTRYNIVALNTYKWIKDAKLPNGSDWKTAQYKSKSFNNNNPIGLYFNDENEATNFFYSCLTTAYKYIVSLMKRDVHVPLQFLPWMGNVEDGYKSPWDNKRFCDYFNITGYIDDEHSEPNSEWEEILNTMEKYK